MTTRTPYDKQPQELSVVDMARFCIGVVQLSDTRELTAVDAELPADMRPLTHPTKQTVLCSEPQPV